MMVFPTQRRTQDLKPGSVSPNGGGDEEKGVCACVYACECMCVRMYDDDVCVCRRGCQKNKTYCRGSDINNSGQNKIIQNNHLFVVLMPTNISTFGSEACLHTLSTSDKK